MDSSFTLLLFCIFASKVALETGPGFTIHSKILVWTLTVFMPGFVYVVEQNITNQICELLKTFGVVLPPDKNKRF